MTERFICPHCHSPLAPLTMEAASSANARLSICPNCDEPIVMAINTAPARAAAPVAARLAEIAAQ